MKSIFLLVLWLGLLGNASAQSAQDVAQQERNAERVRITAERQKIEASFKADEAVCLRQFFANACLEKLLPPRRTALADLRRQEILINELERKISASDQLLKNQESLLLQREKRVEQGVKVQQDADNLAERAKQQEINRGNAAEQAAANKANRAAQLESQQSQAAELEAKRSKAEANVELMRSRQVQAQ
jgi:hypothetical protein